MAELVRTSKLSLALRLSPPTFFIFSTISCDVSLVKMDIVQVTSRAVETLFAIFAAQPSGKTMFSRTSETTLIPVSRSLSCMLVVGRGSLLVTVKVKTCGSPAFTSVCPTDFSI